MLSLPWSVDYFILYYNKEIFAEGGRAGAQDPRRDECARREAHRRESRHLRLCRARPEERQHDAVDQLLPQLRRRIPRRQGQHPHRRPRGDRGDEVLSALRTSPRLPGVAGFNWMESLASFAQGRAAMWIDGVGWAPGVEDPNSSRVVGKVGYAMVPAGPKGQYSATYGDGIGIPAACKNKEAAYLLCQWVVSKTAGRAPAAGRRRRAVPQLDAQRSRKCSKGVTLPKEWLQSVIGAAKISQARPAGHHPGRRVPRPRRRGRHGDAVGRRSRDGAEEGARAVPPDPGAQREGVTTSASLVPASGPSHPSRGCPSRGHAREARA